MSRNGEILGVIETARALHIVLELPIPGWVGSIVAIGERDDGRQIAIRLPGHSAACDAGVEPERVVLVMRRVDVAPREVRLHDEPRVRGSVEAP